MIEVNNLTRRRIDKKFLEKMAEALLKKERKKLKSLSIALVGQTRIKELNRKYRRKNKATSVLSFRYDDTGEVVICPTLVEKTAKKFGLTFNEELTRVLTHGIKNLCQRRT
jgi:probable rRNA maturation factor